MSGSVVGARAIITGVVQGVWYRGWTVETAVALGLDGWVRNRADGSVEALFVGAPEAVAKMLAACRRGPAAAQVRDVVVEPAPILAAGSGFAQRPTVAPRDLDDAGGPFA